MHDMLLRLSSGRNQLLHLYAILALLEKKGTRAFEVLYSLLIGLESLAPNSLFLVKCHPLSHEKDLST